MRSQPFFAPALIAISVLAGCAKADAPEPAEPPTLDVTSWTEKTELFMEYPPLVAGQSARFAVHLTTLADFKALNAGKPSIEMTPESGGASTVLTGTPPLRPGAFRVEGTPPAAGRYRWALKVDAPGLADRHDLGVVTVFGDEKAAVADAEKHQTDDPAAVAYLKEQQWTNAFATALTRETELRTSLRLPASVEPLTGGEAIVSAPAAGRFSATSLPAIGTAVRANQVLGTLEPRLAAGDDRATLAGEVSQAQLALEAGRTELARAERLLADRAVPARRVEDAKRSVAAAEARAKAAEARLAQRDETLRSGGGAASGNAFSLRAPIAGRVTEVKATLGGSYEEGAPLFRIVRTDRVKLRAQIPPADAGIARQISDITFEIPGRAAAVALRADRSRDPGAIDPATGALPLQFDVANPGGQLLIGQHGTAVLYQRDRVKLPAVPKEAVLLEAGRPYVWVQAGGEQFVRRYVEVGARDGDAIGIRAGVKAGDRVVVRGAYEVQLASAAKGLAAEGHVH